MSNRLDKDPMPSQLSTDMWSLKIKLHLDWAEAYNKWKMEDELLRIKREEFLRENPDHPYRDSMYLQVTAPPQKIEITFIK